MRGNVQDDDSDEEGEGEDDDQDQEPTYNLPITESDLVERNIFT